MKRRQFIKMLAAMNLAIVAKLNDVFPELQAAESASQVVMPTIAAPPRRPTHVEVGGELYEGFVLLPDGAPLPDIVRDYRYGIPDGCGVSEPGEPGHREAKPLSVPLRDAPELAARSALPVYTLHNWPEPLRSSGANLIRHETGELFGGWITFESYDPNSRTWYTAVSILAQVDFPQPFPLWFSTPTDSDDPAVVLEKVSFLPTPGVMILTPNGFVLYWIQHSVLYTLSAMDAPFQSAQELASALILVR